MKSQLRLFLFSKSAYILLMDKQILMIFQIFCAVKFVFIYYDSIHFASGNEDLLQIKVLVAESKYFRMHNCVEISRRNANQEGFLGKCFSTVNTSDSQPVLRQVAHILKNMNQQREFIQINNTIIKLFLTIIIKGLLFNYQLSVILIKQQMQSREKIQLREHIITLTKNDKMNEFTSEKIIERLTQKDLIKIQTIMKKHKSLTITTFLRIFRNILNPTSQEDFYVTYALFRLFQQACLQFRKNEINFDDFSNIITQKIQTSNQEIRLSQKLYPLNIEIPENIKRKIIAPQIVGKVLEDRERLEERPYFTDKFLHLNRRVAQTVYSSINDWFFTIDYPSIQVKILDRRFQYIKSLQTQLQISKRDAIINWIAWSEHQQRLAVLLGNYSISLWAKQDDFRYEVNVPLSLSKLASPYVMLGYMESSHIWWALDDRPIVYILSHYDFEPEYQFTHFKMIKEKDTQKMHTVQLKYRKLLCIAFQRNVFVLSLQKRELITQLRNFTTNITSIAFSQCYQALFISTFDTSFSSYELSQHEDLTEKGFFQGHKGLVNLLGVLQGKPVVFSIDERSVIKLWDIRDFQCYQTFEVLKNVDFRQIILLSDSVCFVGSKHVCYRWHYLKQYQEQQKVILITQLHKNILMITSKQVRLYNHSNGVLFKILKGIFGNMHIYSAFLVQIRKILLLANEQGTVKIFSTKDFSLTNTLDLLPKPNFLCYERQTQLLTLSCMGEIKIGIFQPTNDFTIKRRIFNNKQIIRICVVSAAHDLIAVQYDGPHLFFYSYERAKSLGFLILEDLIKIEFLDNKNAVLLLCKDKLMLFSYKKFLNSISFFLKKMIILWSEKQLTSQHVQSKVSLLSTNFVLFDNILIISSNNCSIQCRIKINIDLIKEQLSQIHKQNYNPFRVGTQNHLQSFQMNKPSLVIDQSTNQILQTQQYFDNPSKEHPFQLLSQINRFYCISNEAQSIFYDLNCQSLGVISLKQTLPVNWNLHNYTEKQFNQFQFVLQFIEQEKPTALGDSTMLTKSTSLMQKTDDIITLDMLNPRQKADFRSNSLREKKMVLQKQRDERLKYQNFLQIRKGEELVKLKQINRSSNQKYVSESLAFLNVNRNKLLLSKGNETELPQVRTLQAKLNAVMNRDQKKSMVSKYSYPLQSPSPVKKPSAMLDEKTPKKKQVKLLQLQSQKESIKQHLRKLDITLRQSKFQHKQRSSSLPLLKILKSQNN